jgi:hypothetical protein
MIKSRNFEGQAVRGQALTPGRIKRNDLETSMRFPDKKGDGQASEDTDRMEALFQQ